MPQRAECKSFQQPTLALHAQIASTDVGFSTVRDSVRLVLVVHHMAVPEHDHSATITSPSGTSANAKEKSNVSKSGAVAAYELTQGIFNDEATHRPITTHVSSLASSGHSHPKL